MTKLDIKTNIVIIVVINLLLVGSFGKSTNSLGLREHSAKKTGETYQTPYSETLHASMNDLAVRMKPEDKVKFAMQSSGIITENSNEFLEGTMGNLTLDTNGYLVLDRPMNATEWVNVSSAAPSARSQFSMAYDSKNQKIVLFGGWNGTDPLSDTWVYDLPMNTWIQMNPPSHPSARCRHSMVYSSNSSRVILFGGYDGSPFSDMDDTWVYDLSTDTWTQMTPSMEPIMRFGHSMTYDSDSDKVILYSGDTSLSVILADTWVYDLLTDTWTEKSSSISLGMRNGHSMIYDTKTKGIVLFGGLKGSIRQEDTWTYDYLTDTWSQMTPSNKPSARTSHSMVYDSTSEKTILFGGDTNTGYCNETWAYNFTMNNWTKIDLPSKPSARTGHSIVYNTNYSKIILFGGLSGIGYQNDTWLFSDHYYYNHGKYTSELTYFGSIYSITGDITWNPIDQPENTLLKFQVGFSNTTRTEDFKYTDYYTSNFTFTGVARCLRYQVIFESDTRRSLSPALKAVYIHYFLEGPRPTIQIKNPQNNSIVKGVVHVLALADSPFGIEMVCFWINGLLITRDYSTPYTCSWNSNNSENGYVTVMVVAIDKLGRENADSIQLLVDNSVEFIPIISVPSAPQGLAAMIGDNFVTLSWNTPSDDGGSIIMSYRVYRGTKSGEYLFIGVTTTMSFNDTLLLGEITYYYVVTAINTVGESDFSTEVSATPTGMTIPQSGAFPDFLAVLFFLGILVVLIRKHKKI